MVLIEFAWRLLLKHSRFMKKRIIETGLRNAIFSYIEDHGKNGNQKELKWLFLCPLMNYIKKDLLFLSISHKKIQRYSQVLIQENFGKDLKKEIKRLLEFSMLLDYKNMKLLKYLLAMMN